MSKPREYFKFNFSKVVRFDCTCGRRYINTDKCLQETDSRMPQTRADVIRSMSDEELAGFLYGLDHYWDDGQCIVRINDTHLNDSKDDILDWLQSEAE